MPQYLDSLPQGKNAAAKGGVDVYIPGQSEDENRQSFVTGGSDTHTCLKAGKLDQLTS